MANSINDQVLELFYNAVSEGRDDIVTALSSFVPLKELAVWIGKKYNDSKDSNSQIHYAAPPAIIAALKRDTYSAEEVESIFARSGMEDSNFRDELTSHFASISDIHTRHLALFRLFVAGHHAESLKILESSQDVALSAQLLHDAVEDLVNKVSHRWRHKNDEVVILGAPGKLSEASVKIFHLANIDYKHGLDDQQLSDSSYRHGDIWSTSRFNVQFENVGKIVASNNLELATVKSTVNGLILENPEVPIALAKERERVTANGFAEWHQNSLPDAFPVRVLPESVPEIIRAGGSILKPRFTVTETHNGYESEYADHGFDVTAGRKISRNSIIKGTSLLSRTQYEDARNDSHCVIALLPLETLEKFSISKAKTVDELGMAMRMHRPTINRKFIHECRVEMYLRGFPIIEDGISLDMHQHVSLEDFDYLTSEQEGISFASQFDYTKRNARCMHVHQATPNLTESANIIARQHADFVSRFGFYPHIEFRVTKEFLKALAELKHDFGDNNFVSNTKAQRISGDGWDEYLCAVGSNMSELRGLTLSEIITKAVRMNTRLKALEESGDKSSDSLRSQLTRIIGRIRTYPDDEILGAIRTPAQIGFAIDRLTFNNEQIKKMNPELRKKYQNKRAARTLNL
ncbi:hypothetical protein ACYPKM_03335 [Pseudomonas aeruginosa]